MFCLFVHSYLCVEETSSNELVCAPPPAPVGLRWKNSKFTCCTCSCPCPACVKWAEMISTLNCLFMMVTSISLGPECCTSWLYLVRHFWMRLPLRGAIGCSTLMTMNDRPSLKCSVDPDQDQRWCLGSFKTWMSAFILSLLVNERVFALDHLDCEHVVICIDVVYLCFTCFLVMMFWRGCFVRSLSLACKLVWSSSFVAPRTSCVVAVCRVRITEPIRTSPRTELYFPLRSPSLSDWQCTVVVSRIVFGVCVSLSWQLLCGSLLSYTRPCGSDDHMTCQLTGICTHIKRANKKHEEKKQQTLGRILERPRARGSPQFETHDVC